MDERFELKEFNQDLYRLDRETGETCKLATRHWTERYTSENFSADYFKHVEEPPEIEEESEEEGEGVKCFQLG